MYATLLDDPDLMNRQLDRYLAVTAADIQAVAAEFLVPDNRVVLTYIPAAASQGEETAA
jgi:predicted Zn-dependent peptidase